MPSPALAVPWILAPFAAGPGVTAEQVLAEAERPVLVVQTPGLRRRAMVPLLQALVDAGFEPVVLEAPCTTGSAAELAAGLGAVAAAAPEAPVLAHGLGAGLVLMADPAMGDRSVALIAPTLAVVPSPLTEQALAADVGASVVFDPLHPPWRELLDVAHPPVGCLSPALAREVQGWVAAGGPPVDLGRIDRPVWVGVALGDDVATVEAVVPASRALPDRTLVRFGRNRWDPEDYGHVGLLLEPRVHRTLLRWLREQP